MKNTRAMTVINVLRTLSDFDLDAVRKAMQEEGERRGRAWAQPQGGGGFGRRQAS